MTDPHQKDAEELRLCIALLRGFRPVSQPGGTIKLLRPIQPGFAFGPPRSQEAPDWPHDMTAAMRLTSNEFSRDDQRLLVERRGGQWRCEIFDGERLYEGRGETGPIAVCRAYLLAKRGEE